jgi:mono/diheme cytochrome c family protein
MAMAALTLAIAGTDGSVRAGEAAAPVASAAPALASLRDQVRGLAQPHCGSCHQGSLPTAKPGALAVFDLERADWPTRMKTPQLDKFLGRIKGKLDEPKLQVVRAFIAAERGAR